MRVKEITIDIGAVSNITVDLLNTYLKPSEYGLDGFHVVNVNGTYPNVCTLLVNGVLSKDGIHSTMYGYAIAISCYTGFLKFRMSSGVWTAE